MSFNDTTGTSPSYLIVFAASMYRTSAKIASTFSGKICIFKKIGSLPQKQPELFGESQQRKNA
jgi:hypothetical protein